MRHTILTTSIVREALVEVFCCFLDECHLQFQAESETISGGGSKDKRTETHSSCLATNNQRRKRSEPLLVGELEVQSNSRSKRL